MGVDSAPAIGVGGLLPLGLTLVGVLAEAVPLETMFLSSSGSVHRISIEDKATSMVASGWPSTCRSGSQATASAPGACCVQK